MPISIFVIWLNKCWAINVLCFFFSCEDYCFLFVNDVFWICLIELYFLFDCCGIMEDFVFGLSIFFCGFICFIAPSWKLIFWISSIWVSRRITSQFVFCIVMVGFLEGFCNGLIFILFSELQELIEIVVILLCWFLCSSVTFGRWWKLNYIILEWGKVLVGDQAFKQSANHLFKNECEAARLRILLDQNEVRNLRKQHWFQRRKKKKKKKTGC